jgi:hypothetical protein
MKCIPGHSPHSVSFLHCPSSSHMHPTLTKLPTMTLPLHTVLVVVLGVIACLVVCGTAQHNNYYVPSQFKAVISVWCVRVVW